ncbi:ABC transporter ATP-binding protein [Noviherbaspirillum malthae]|uniref:ABC transporter ATP-binding protein n=1 Tax=Noviherbaspirillum malthae TaxID=1260987 RepID=UPI00188E15A0|nr:ABC transporter ATP-binding protein [Noviherbaspirillum malthae]
MPVASTLPAKAGHLDVQNLRIEFNAGRGATTVAVDDVSISIAPGEFVSIVGPSGCGKSTLLNAIAGFIKPAHGRITIDSKPIQGPASDRGVVFQQYSLFPWKTVLGNVEFGLKLQGVPRRTRIEEARRLLRLSGLSQFERHYLYQLSGGMKQRVGILRALAANPSILLMDEPFGALDTQTRSIMQQLLTDLWESLGISVLFITHDIDEAIFLSDRVYVMSARPGRIKEIVPVTLPRPRTGDTVTAPDFLAFRARVHSLIRDESIRTFESETNHAYRAAA